MPHFLLLSDLYKRAMVCVCVSKTPQITKSHEQKRVPGAVALFHSHVFNVQLLTAQDLCNTFIPSANIFCGCVIKSWNLHRKNFLHSVAWRARAEEHQNLIFVINISLISRRELELFRSPALCCKINTNRFLNIAFLPGQYHLRHDSL